MTIREEPLHYKTSKPIINTKYIKFLHKPHTEPHTPRTSNNPIKSLCKLGDTHHTHQKIKKQ